MSKQERIRLFRVFMSEESIRITTETLKSGFIGQGPRVEEFEDQLQNVLNLPHRPLTLSSCTAGLDLSYYMIGIKAGDTVVSTPLTCTATNSNLATRGAKILWADIDPITGLINSDDAIEKASNNGAKAIVAVDWAGRICDYDTLRKAKVPIVRDAAHSFLSGVGKITGDYISWSFQAIKSLTCADGGLLLTPPEEYARAKLLRWYGLDRTKGEAFRCSIPIHEAGFKYHMNDVSASIGIGNLSRIHEVVGSHRSNAAWFEAHLPEESPRFSKPPPDQDAAWWLYTVIVDDQTGFIQHMVDRGIDASPVHARNDAHPAFKAATHKNSGKLPGVDYFSSHEVAIPVGWWITEEDRQRILKAVEEWIA